MARSNKSSFKLNPNAVMKATKEGASEDSLITSERVTMGASLLSLGLLGYMTFKPKSKQED